jgi:DNA-directed RNA polymerase subunit RPC12/RpoP
MASVSKPSSQLRHAVFDKRCDYCGAKFQVELARQEGGNPQRVYACPECGKHYEAMSTLPLKVRLLSPRSDGKSGGYQETMF